MTPPLQNAPHLVRVLVAVPLALAAYAAVSLALGGPGLDAPAGVVAAGLAVLAGRRRPSDRRC